jgi:parallel beta-helix repeat protein
VIDNFVEKSHENGVKIVGNTNATRAKPKIYRNKIFSCGYNGIVCMGEHCEPDIRGNIIESNRKAGIKITERATAHIGGTHKD